MVRACILEDDLLILEAFRTMVEACGVDVVYAGKDPAGFASAVSETSPDVVFVDVKLRGSKSGIDEVANIQRHGFKGRVVMVSAYPQHTIEKQLARIHFDAYLVKPVSQRALETVISGVHSEHS